MYCKYCGEQVEEDSKFCKHCGKSLITQEIKDSRNPFNDTVEKFKKLSIVKQISSIIYIIWFLGWLCFVIDSSYMDEALSLAIIFVFIIPLIIVCFIYYGRLYLVQRKQNGTMEISGKDGVLAKEVCLWKLKQFVNLYGKLKYCPANASFKNRLACINGDKITFINLSSELENITPAQVIKYQEVLSIKKLDDNSFELYSDTPISEFEANWLPF